MSDNEDFMMSDGDSYEFEFEESGDEEDQSMVESNETEDFSILYDNGKSIKNDDPEEAIKIFGKILDIENNGGNENLNLYQFKSFKQTLKILYKLSKFDEFIAIFKKLSQFQYLSNLKKNYIDDSFSRMIDFYIGFSNNSRQLEFLNVLIDDFDYQFNERFLMKVNLKKVQILLTLKKFDLVLTLLNELYLKINETIPEISKNTYLLELYSIEIQVYTETDNINKLKELYNKTLSIQSTIPHPRIFAIIKECGGKMYLRDENYELATNEFYESFKNYDEIGNHFKRINLLKYLIISSILSSNEIKKFESQETKFFLNDENILDYILFIKRFENLENEEFETIFNKLIKTDSNDLILINHLYKVERIFKLKLLVHYIKPFKKLSLIKLSENLKLPIDSIEDIMLNLKNNGELQNVKLDLIDGIIYNE